MTLPEPTAPLPPIEIPEVIDRTLRAGTPVAVSISGGVDGQAALYALARLRAANPTWRSPIHALHAEVGRMDWADTPALIAAQAAAADAPLTRVRRADGTDLLDHIDARAAKIAVSEHPDRPHWPSSAARYCTSDLKRGPLDSAFRGLWPRGVVIDVQGIRAEESPARAGRAAVQIRPGPSSAVLTRLTPDDALDLMDPYRQRLVLTWYPLHRWSKADCFHACGTSLADLAARRARYADGDVVGALSGWPCASSYVRGASRHSCVLCVLASRADLAVGVRARPDLAGAIAARERATGWRFRQDVAIGDLIITG